MKNFRYLCLIYFNEKDNIKLPKTTIADAIGVQYGNNPQTKTINILHTVISITKLLIIVDRIAISINVLRLVILFMLFTFRLYFS